MLFVLLHHLREVGSALLVILVRSTEHDLILQIIIFELLVTVCKKMRERLHDAMRLTHGFNVMQGKSRIARAHLCNVPQFREFLPDRPHGEIPLHEVLLHVCVVIDTKCLFECNIIVHESINRDPRIRLDLTRLTELVLIRHKVIDERLRPAHILCKFAALISTLLDFRPDVRAQRACCMVGDNAHGSEHKIHSRTTEITRCILHLGGWNIHPVLVARRNPRLMEFFIGIDNSCACRDYRTCQIAPRIHNGIRHRSFGEALIPRLCLPRRLILCLSFLRLMRLMRLIQLLCACTHPIHIKRHNQPSSSIIP